MRPIDFCTPKPLLEHSCSVASQRCDRFSSNAHPCGARCPRVALVPEPCGSVLAHANVFFACSPARPKTRGAGTGKLGAARCRLRLGRTALHGAFPTSALGRSCGRAFSSLARESDPLASDTPVASSVAFARAPLGNSRVVLRRPPRPVPRGPRERRAHSRSRVPSVDSSRARIPAAQKHGRNHAAFSGDAALT